MNFNNVAEAVLLESVYQYINLTTAYNVTRKTVATYLSMLRQIQNWKHGVGGLVGTVGGTTEQRRKLSGASAYSILFDDVTE